MGAGAGPGGGRGLPGAPGVGGGLPGVCNAGGAAVGCGGRRWWVVNLPRRGRRRGRVFVPGPGGKTHGALNLLESHSC